MDSRWAAFTLICLAGCSAAPDGLSEDESTIDSPTIRSDAGRDAATPRTTIAPVSNADAGSDDFDAGHQTTILDSSAPADAAAADGSADARADARPVDPPEPRVPNPVNAFTGAKPYQFIVPDPANAHHPAPVTGKPCLDCHGGNTTAPKFDFAGTIYQAPLLWWGAAGAEIRIIDRNGYPATVHADTDGNFWHRADKDLALPAFSGARSATWGAVGQLNGASCNSCHTPSKKLYVQ